MSRFTVLDTPLTQLKVVQHQEISDNRGLFARIFCAEDLLGAGWRKPVAQINQTVTQTLGTVRGMHYQRSPHAEMKLVTCRFMCTNRCFLSRPATVPNDANGRTVAVRSGRNRLR